MLLLALTACAGSDRQEASGPVADSAAGQGAPMPAAVQADGPRQVVYTGDLVVRVSSVRRAAAGAAEIAMGAGGFVFSQATDRDEASVTVKVPGDRFDATVEAMADLGTELRRDLAAQDVTAEVVDVEGRLKTAEASAARLRTLLSEAKTSADLVAVEGELAERETAIESIQGRLRVLEDQVALATLTVRLTRRDDITVADDLPGFLGGLRGGVVALVNIAQVLLVAVGFALPFAPIVALALWAARRYRRRHPRPPRPPGPPTGPTWPPPPGQPSTQAPATATAMVQGQAPASGTGEPSGQDQFSAALPHALVLGAWLAIGPNRVARG